MLVIRLQRVGKKGQPSYRLAVAERRSKLTASPTEDLGSYSIKTKEATFHKDRILHWISKGAQPTVTVHNLLVKHGVLTGPKIKLHLPVKAAPAQAEAAPATQPAAPVAEKAEAPAAAEATPAAEAAVPAETAS